MFTYDIHDDYRNLLLYF